MDAEAELAEVEHRGGDGGTNTFPEGNVSSNDDRRVSALPSNLEMSPSKSTSVSDSTIKRRTEPKVRMNSG